MFDARATPARQRARHSCPIKIAQEKQPDSAKNMQKERHTHTFSIHGDTSRPIIPAHLPELRRRRLGDGQLDFLLMAQRLRCAAAIRALPSGLMRCFFCGGRVADPAVLRPPSRFRSSDIF